MEENQIQEVQPEQTERQLLHDRIAQLKGIIAEDKAKSGASFVSETREVLVSRAEEALAASDEALVVEFSGKVQSMIDSILAGRVQPQQPDVTPENEA